jgi:hypothetical protein
MVRTNKITIGAASNIEAAPVLEKDNVIYFKANRPLTKNEFELLDEMVRLENKKSGCKIVLLPFSADIIEK